MDGKIAYDSAAVSAVMVSLLEEILEEARLGRLRCVAFCAVTVEHDVRFAMHKTVDTPWVSVIGAISVLGEKARTRMEPE